MNASSEHAFLDSGRLIKGVLNRIVSKVGGEAFYLNVHLRDGVNYLSGTDGTGHLRSQVQAYNGWPAPDGCIQARSEDSAYSVACPLSSHTNAFATLWDENPDSLRESETWRIFYEPQGIGDQLRALLYSGRQFVGYLAVCRGVGESFSRQDKAVADSMVGGLIEELRAAVQLGEEQFRDASPIVAWDHRGVLYASETARAWLTPDRTRYLLSSRSSEPRLFIDGFRLTTRRMEPEGIFLTSFHYEPQQSIAAARALSDCQRTIAELAASGLTNAEIAQTVGFSVSAVKYHLRLVFDAYDIRDRRELALEQTAAELLG